MIRQLNVLIILIALLLAGTTYTAEISISRIDNAIAGEHKFLNVSVDSIVSDISAFNLTIAYDQSSSFVYAVRPGDIFDSCGWEYFNYRLIPRDTLAVHLSGFPVHLINVTGLAALNGNPVPVCSEGSATLFELGLVLSREYTYEEQFLPFRFFWRDCGDNILVSKSGDTVYSAQALFEDLSIPQAHEPINPAFPGYGFPPTACPAQQNATVTANLNFVNSGIWVYYNFDGYCGGDVNLNGIPYEIADAVLLICYFTHGLACFSINPAAQLAETDCNCDGLILSVSDLVCFIRKAVGDDRFGKIIPFYEPAAPVLFISENGNLKTIGLNSEAKLALAYLRIFPKSNNQLEPNDFSFKQASAGTGQISDTITMILVDLEGNSVLSAGEHQLLEYAGNSEFGIEAWVVDMQGNETALKLESTTLPTTPELSQNYPNPFNPRTTIEFTLPANTEWKIQIYNLTGQLIKNYSGTASGFTRIEWNGTNSNGAEVTSGIYFYKLISNDVTLSRKMLLLR